MSRETEGSEPETQLATDYQLIRSGGPGWGEAFRRFRRALGIGQKKLAARMGVHPTTFTKWEHGRSNPTREARERALAAIGWTPPPPPTPSPAAHTEVRTPVSEKKQMSQPAPDYVPPPYTPPRRRRTTFSSVRIWELTGQWPEPQEDPDSPYFYSK